MAMDSRNKFSMRLKELRKEYGFTPMEFAELLNLGRQRYYSYENGRAVPSFNTLMNIAEKCNVSLDWLCGHTPTTQNKIEIENVLSQLLYANEMGNQIEVQIFCKSIAADHSSGKN